MNDATISRLWVYGFAAVLLAFCGLLACVTGNKGIDDQSKDKGKIESHPVATLPASVVTSQSAGRDANTTTTVSPTVNQNQGFILTSRDALLCFVAYMAYDLLKDIAVGKWIKRSNGRA